MTLADRTSTITSLRKAYSHYPKIGSVIALDPKLDQQKLTRTVRRPTQDHIYCTIDFIVSLPKTARGFHAIATWVDRLSRGVHFVPSHETDPAVQVAESFFGNIFRHYGLPGNLVSDHVHIQVLVTFNVDMWYTQADVHEPPSTN